MEKVFASCCCLLVCTQFSVLIATGSLAITFYNQGFEIPNLDYLNQIVRDWETPPYTEIVVITEDQGNCDENGYEPVFQHEWLGTDIACDCLGIYSEWIKYPNEFAVGGVCEKNETLYGCYSSPPLPPIVTTRFQGRSVCGKRAELPFVNITRPDFSPDLVFECPRGYRSCFDYYGRSDLNTENQVCYLDLRDTFYFDENCPIVAMNFTTNDLANKTETYLNSLQIDPNDWSNHSFSIVSYNTTHNIVYSKAMDSLPIVDTYVGGIPCLDPFQTSVQSVNTFTYQADILGQNFGCQPQPNGYRIDSRYQNIGFAASESQIKSSNRIDQIYQYFRTTDSASAQDSIAASRNQYSFWVRPTIPWRILCESEGFTRQDVLSDFGVRMSYQEDHALSKYRLGVSVVSILSVCLVVPVFMCLPVICKSDGCGCFMVTNMIVWFILAIPMMILNGYEWGLINYDLERLDELKWTERCTDPQTQIGSISSFEQQFDDIFSSTKNQFALTVTYFSILGIQFLCLCCGLVSSGRCCQGNSIGYSWCRETKEFFSAYMKLN